VSASSEEEAREHEPRIVICGVKNKISKTPPNKAKRPSVLSV